MRYGLAFFPTEYAIAPAELAHAAEERGFESLFFTEHTHIPASRVTPYPAGGELPREYSHTYDPFVALMSAAAATTTLNIGTAISLVVEHDPIVLAKTVATLDQLSAGRFLFGVGAGWNLEEMANHGTDPSRRFALMTERVKAMRAIWADDEATFHGEFVNFDRIWSWPEAAATARSAGARRRRWGEGAAARRRLRRRVAPVALRPAQAAGAHRRAPAARRGGRARPHPRHALAHHGRARAAGDLLAGRPPPRAVPASHAGARRGARPGSTPWRASCRTSPPTALWACSAGPWHRQRRPKRGHRAVRASGRRARGSSRTRAGHPPGRACRPWSCPGRPAAPRCAWRRDQRWGGRSWPAAPSRRRGRLVPRCRGDRPRSAGRDRRPTPARPAWRRGCPTTGDRRTAGTARCACRCCGGRSTTRVAATLTACAGPYRPPSPKSGVVGRVGVRGR